MRINEMKAAASKDQRKRKRNEKRRENYQRKMNDINEMKVAASQDQQKRKRNEKRRENYQRKMNDLTGEHLLNYKMQKAELERQRYQQNKSSLNNLTSRDDFIMNERDQDTPDLRPRHYQCNQHQMNENAEDSFLKDEINESEVRKVLKEMAEKDENEYIENNPDKRSAVVCVVCDCIILDADDMECVDKNDLLQSCDKLSITAYRDHFGYDSLNEELIKQYQVQDEDLHGYLLSPCSKLSKNGYQCCSSCKLSLSSKTEACPKYSIAN
jgi:hypothetical protein